MIQTRQNEIRFTTADPALMRGKFIATPILRTWNEDHTDPETAQTVTAEHSELIARRGEYIDDDLLARIRFFMTEGSITAVEVSNQRRRACQLQDGGIHTYIAGVRISRATRTYILYADSLGKAVRILTDYIELHAATDDLFQLLRIAETTYRDTIIDPDVERERSEKQNTGPKPKDTPPETRKKPFLYYDITTRIITEDEQKGLEAPATPAAAADDDEPTRRFFVKARSAKRAIQLIRSFLTEEERQKAQTAGGRPQNFDVFIEESKKKPACSFIPVQFSMAYRQYETENQKQ